MKWLVLVVSCVLVPASGWGTEKQFQSTDLIEQSVNQRLKAQDERLGGLAEYVSWKRNSIEQGYALSLTRLKQRAQHRASRIPFTYKLLWTEFWKMNSQKPYTENYFWKSELTFWKDEARFRVAMKDNYFTGTMRDLLLDEDFRRLLDYIVNVDHFHNPVRTVSRDILYREARDLLRLVDEFQRQARQLDNGRRAGLAYLDQWEKDCKEDVLRVKRVIGAEVKKPKLGVVSAIGYGDTGAFCMVAGVDGILRAGDTVDNNVKITRIGRDEVEFVKNSRSWTQRVGEQPDSAWPQK